MSKRVYANAWLKEILDPDRPLLIVEGDMLISKGLRKEARKQLSRREKAQAAAKTRWHECGRILQASPKQCIPSPFPTPSPKGYINKVWSEWVEAKIQDSRVVSSAADIQAINTAAQSYQVEIITEAIKTYAKILHDDGYILTTRWTLADFLGKHLSKFLDGSQPQKLYEKRGADRRKKRRHIDEILRDREKDNDKSGI